MNAEQSRLEEDRIKKTSWKKWGSYLSERQWGTVREDYSQGGDAWNYFSHDQARSRAYRWGEDGLAGVSDDKQQLCFALALWNGNDPILKERLFGLTNSVPTLWFRNDWATWITGPGEKPILMQIQGPAGTSAMTAHHPLLGTYNLYCEGEVALLFTENETNNDRLFPEYPNPAPYVKDGINDFVVQGRHSAVNPEHQGTKGAAHYRQMVEPGQSMTVRLRLASQGTVERDENENGMTMPFGRAFAEILAARLQEAEEFYHSVIPASVSPDAANVMRQALAGMLWSKQYYYFDADRWLSEHDAHPLYPDSRYARNRDWFHMVNCDIISMPDKWEYPWYAAWDLAFHTLPLSIVDSDFAKQQMDLMLHGLSLHPNGQMPASEWNFGDVNPPVHAFATLFLHRAEQALHGETDVNFLKSAFNRLLLNFTWWVNRKDRFGKNVFEGGFLGLDNIGIFDRSAPLPSGGHLEQADGTAWMALFSQNMLEIAVELVADDPTYEDMVTKFVEHFLYIAVAMNKPGSDGMWDEEDGFYYDLLRLQDGSAQRLKVRSMVGLLPLCATTVVEPWQRELIPGTVAALQARIRQMPELLESIHPTGRGNFGVADRGMIALLNPERLRRVLSKMLDEDEFLSPYGIRSLSKFHEENPYILHVGGLEYRVDYLPAESNTGMFGGNSNWRGPVWMPVNTMIIRALLNFYLYYGDNFRIECPTGSGKLMNLFEVSKDIADRLSRIFLRNEEGQRPVYGGTEKFQSDPHWRDHLLFYEYFHGDNGAGLGASHQTGWTGGVAKLIQLYGLLDAQQVLEGGKRAAFKRGNV